MPNKCVCTCEAQKHSFIKLIQGFRIDSWSLWQIKNIYVKPQGVLPIVGGLGCSSYFQGVEIGNSVFFRD